MQPLSGPAHCTRGTVLARGKHAEEVAAMQQGLPLWPGEVYLATSPSTVRRRPTSAHRSFPRAQRRPGAPYQQNDYLGWISRAKLDATKAKRLAQMLEELERGDRYMKMAWRQTRRAHT